MLTFGGGENLIGDEDFPADAQDTCWCDRGGTGGVASPFSAWEEEIQFLIPLALVSDLNLVWDSLISPLEGTTAELLPLGEGSDRAWDSGVAVEILEAADVLFSGASGDIWKYSGLSTPAKEYSVNSKICNLYLTCIYWKDHNVSNC